MDIDVLTDKSHRELALCKLFEYLKKPKALRPPSNNRSQKANAEAVLLSIK